MSQQTSADLASHPMPYSDVIVASEDLRKKYGDQLVLDLPGRIEIRNGFTAIVGESGSGKSTYLNILAGFVAPSEGSVSHYNDGEVTFVTKEARALSRIAILRESTKRHLLLETSQERRSSSYRSKKLGYIAQQPAMHPYLTMRDYIEYTHACRGNQLDMSRHEMLASALGITALLDKKPSELSGGEEQRGAIMSALVHNPDLIFADEPTSALDPDTSQKSVELMRRLCDEGSSVIMVTHNQSLVSKYADQVIEMREGKIVQQ